MLDPEPFLIRNGNSPDREASQRGGLLEGSEGHHRRSPRLLGRSWQPRDAFPCELIFVVFMWGHDVKVIWHELSREYSDTL